MLNTPPPPFFIGMTDALMDRWLNGTDIRVLCALCSFYNRKTGECWPSKKSIQERSGMGRTVTSDALRKLRDLGYIDYWKSWTKAGNEYAINFPNYGEGVGGPDTPLPDIPTPLGQDVRHGDDAHSDTPPVATSDPKQRTKQRSEQTNELTNEHRANGAFARLSDLNSGTPEAIAKARAAIEEEAAKELAEKEAANA
jgi:hypothetical protein